MVCKYAIVALVGLLISSCAQVGVISGGDVDRFAPKPITDELVPLNETTNFHGNTIEIPFDEYFRLVNPALNIIMVPPHTKIKATVKNKTLILKWEDTLEVNTTYAIYLNNAIKDLNEANDTIIQYVFSTGPALDTLTFSVPVNDAWTNKAMDDCIVALFQTDSDKLVSLAKPSKGIARLNYLRAGDYRLVAFKDENNDLALQDYERIAFPEKGNVTINESLFDSIPLRMFTPKQKPKISSLKFIPPCSFILSATRSLFPVDSNVDTNKNVIMSFAVDGVPVESVSVDAFSKDSILFYYDNVDSNSVQITYHYETIYDTIDYRFKPKERERKIIINTLNSGLIAPSSDITFITNGQITGIDQSKIKIINSQDSTEIVDFTSIFSFSEFFIQLKRDGIEALVFEFEAGAISTSCGSSEVARKTISLNTLDDYGILIVDVSGYDQPIIVQLLQSNKMIKSTIVLDSTTPVIFDELPPGEYYFKVIRDSNNNGQWDVGDYLTLSQPEKIDEYSKKIKVRLNWTIDVILTPID